MKLAKVIGNIVATRKEESLVGSKLMIVKRIDSKSEYIDSEEIAVDFVGAGIGDVVLVAQGSAVRIDPRRKESMIDMAIIGIIDAIDI